MLVDRRDELGRARTQTVNRLHRLLLELFPGGAKTFLSSQQARAMIATIKPRDLVGKTRRRLAVELIVELEGIDKRIKTIKKELTALVTERGSTLLELNGIGSSGAARLLADVGDIHRFADRNRFASWNGTAPWTPPPETRTGAGSPERGTGGSTGLCTSWCSAEVVGKDERPVVVVLSQRNAPHADRLGRGASWYQSHHDRLGRRAVAPSGRGVQRHQRIGLGVVGGGASTRSVVLDGSESP